MTRFVFVHGWGFDARFWRPLLEHFYLKRSLCADLGYYRATHIPDLDDDGYILVAHSAGLLWSLQNLPRPQKIIAINSFAKFTQSEDFSSGVLPQHIDRMQKKWNHEPLQVLHDFFTRIEAGYDLSHELPDTQALGAGLDMLRRYDGRKALQDWNCPVLALAGGDDPLVLLPHAQSFESLRLNLDLRVSPSGGHILPIRHPDWCAAQIQQFCD